jgi:hypothetical protein
MSYTSASAGYPHEEGQGDGWVAFAGIMIAIVAILNIIFGIAAIGDSKFYFASSTYVIHDLNVYGWIVLLTGVVQFAAVLGIYTRTTWARWVGIVSAGGNAIVQVVWIATYPLGALAMLTIDVLVIYGLVAHWHERPSA